MERWYCGFQARADRSLEPLGGAGPRGVMPVRHALTREITCHQKEFKSFETAQKLKRRLICLLNTTVDGWVPTHLWEATKVAHQEAFNEIAEAIGKAESTDPEAFHAISFSSLKRCSPGQLNRNLDSPYDAMSGLFWCSTYISRRFWIRIFG